MSSSGSPTSTCRRADGLPSRVMRENWRIWWQLNWLTVLLVVAWVGLFAAGIVFGGATNGPDLPEACDPGPYSGC